MATSQKLEEHFLTCTICTEVFDNPCTLVCYHTFCRKCVVNYTKTKPEAISAKSLLCPFCSKMTNVSEPDRPLEEWADDVKPSFVIQGLLDSFGPGSKGTTNCTWCHAEGETTPASVWCSVCDESMCDRCARMHKRLPSIRHHDVIDLSGEVNIPRKRNVMCSEHKDECVKFLCKDCKKLTCQTCCIIYHRKCESVVTLESELPALKSKLLNEKENILKKQMLMEKKVDTVKSNVITEKDRYVQMESKIKSSGIKARETITLKENKLLDELKEISERHIEQLNADVKSAEISVQMYRQQAELINQTLQSECDMDVYEMYQGCDAGDEDDVGHTDLKEKGRIARITFRQDSDKLSKAVDDLQLGEIDVLYDGVLDLAVTPVLRDTINVTVAGDQHDARLRDVTALVIHNTHTVVATDNRNMSVKSFYTRDNQSCHSKLSLDSRPWGLTKLQHNQVAVTVENKTIITVEVNPDLVLLSTITTNKQYYGITSLTPSTLAAGSRSPPCVDILDMTGNVLRSVSPLCNGTKILKIPWFLCTTRTGNILVSDFGSQRVLCLTPEGAVVFTYTPTGHTTQVYPLGITSTNTGDILVTFNSQNNVVHLTESGQFVRYLLTASVGVDRPYGVCADGCGLVYVCNLRSGDIKVLTCSNTERESELV